MRKILSFILLCLLPLMATAQNQQEKPQNMQQQNELQQQDGLQTPPEASRPIVDAQNQPQIQNDTPPAPQQPDLRRQNSLQPAQPSLGNPPKKRRGTGFFIQGGVNMSLHRF